jgi:16S rRNA (guanine527-N7)-methyltransferase
MEVIEKYFTSLSDNQIKNFKQLEPLYREWNDKINVISRKDIDQLYLRHVLHSLSIAKYFEFIPNQKVIDIGTGGGFPGIPLAILFPETRFTLVDSVQKKIKVVEAVVDLLGLKNVRARQTRAENISEKYDVVVCRAVASLSKLIWWTKKNIKISSSPDTVNGLIALKGGDLSSEIIPQYKTRIIEIQDYFEEPFFQTKKIVHITFVN